MRLPLRLAVCNIIAVHMMSQSHHHTAVVGAEPGFSLLRLSALARIGLALVLVAAVWAATLAVIL